MVAFDFDPAPLPAGIPEFRREIREFLSTELSRPLPQNKANSWTIFNPAFSRKLGARGWIGMVWPRKYCGHDRGAIKRYVVLEELLAAGAPVGAHWVADRQSGPALLKYGSKTQRETYLPG